MVLLRQTDKIQPRDTQEIFYRYDVLGTTSSRQEIFCLENILSLQGDFKVALAVFQEHFHQHAKTEV